MTPELRPTWICSECGMRVYNSCGDAIPAPTGWDRATDRCLACVKQDETQESAEDRAHRLVLDGRKTNEIARSCKGVTKGWINDLRDRLIASGDLDPAAVEKVSRPKRDPEHVKDADLPKVPAVEDALRADPTQTNGVIGAEAGVSHSVVAAVRKRLGVPDSNRAQKLANNALIEQALREHPDLTDEQIGERIGLKKGTVGARRRKLGIEGKRPYATVGSN